MTLLKEPDFGTPAKDGPASVSLEVDGLRVAVAEGTSVMRAAALAGIDGNSGAAAIAAAPVSA